MKNDIRGKTLLVRMKEPQNIMTYFLPDWDKVELTEKKLEEVKIKAMKEHWKNLGWVEPEDYNQTYEAQAISIFIKILLSEVK